MDHSKLRLNACPHSPSVAPAKAGGFVKKKQGLLQIADGDVRTCWAFKSAAAAAGLFGSKVLRGKDGAEGGGFSLLFSAGGGMVSGASGGDSFGWMPLMARLSLRRSLNTADFGMGIGVPPAAGGG